MKRRHLLKYGGAAAAILPFTGGVGITFVSGRAQGSEADVNPLDHSSFTLAVFDTEQELIDGTIVFTWAFGLSSAFPSIPGPPLRARQGQKVTVTLENHSSVPHAFAIPGIPDSQMPPVLPRSSGTISFRADMPGTYMYADPLDAPVNRVLGLHGAFVVDPAHGITARGNPMPYAPEQVSDAVEALFDELGQGAFPGDTWRPEPELRRERIWVFSQIDPRYNERASRGEWIAPEDMLANFTPRYFTINGLSGFDAAHDPATVPKGHIGEPMLLRVINAGLTAHAPHIHGNHVFELSEIDPLSERVVVRDNVLYLDTWAMPRGMRKDMLLPYIMPPDIPLAAWPPREEMFPFKYPMHCHLELSQSAGGGGYPMGLVTDWEIEGLFPGPPHAAAPAHHG